MKEKNKIYYFPGGTRFSVSDFSKKLLSAVQNFYQKNGPCPILFLCIGSDRITGDSLGPLVGYKLEEQLHQSKNCPDYQVLGTLSHPVHALNLRQAIHAIRQTNIPYLIIAIDAAVGLKESIGCITLSEKPLTPGEGINRSLPRVGQISVTGIVSDEDCNLPFHLQNIRLHTVMQMADLIYQGLLTFLYSYSSQLPAPAVIPDFPDRTHQGLPVSACSLSPYPDEPHRHL